MNTDQPDRQAPAENLRTGPNVKPEKGSDDSAADSYAKAIVDPIRSAADGEEPPDDGSHAPVAPG